MKYIDRMNRFWAFQAVADGLGAKEAALYFWLLNCANRQGWPESFEVPTQKTLAALGFTSRSTLARSRDKIAAAGLVRVEYAKGNKKPRYWITDCATIRDIDCDESETLSATHSATQSGTPSKKNKTKKKTESRGADALSSRSLFSLIGEMQKQFPKRADVEKCANAASEYYAAKGQPLTGEKLRAWIAGEKFPEYHKAAGPEPISEPEGWRERFADLFPGADLPEKWADFVHKYGYAPDIMAKVRGQFSTVCDENCDENCDTNCDERSA